MLKICCVWVRGHVDYPIKYVTRLRSMAMRYAPEHAFFCLTDRPDELPKSINPIVTSPVGNGPVAWWKKLELFSVRELQVGRILYLDLDSLIVARLRPIVDFPAPFALIPDAGTFQPRDGHHVVKRFNSSVMVWEGGTVNRLFDDWTPQVADRLWGDQDWIGERMPLAHKMPLEWFPRLSSLIPPIVTPSVKVESPMMPIAAKVVLCKKPKNVQAAQRWPWFDHAWN